jgi:hypothetical protein
MSKEKLQMEVLASPQELLRTPGMQGEIRKLAIELAAQIIAEKEQAIWEPYFRSRQVAYELKRLQNVSDQNSWKIYYLRFGCMICETTERVHGGCGKCTRCYAYVLGRLKQIRGEQIRDRAAHPARGRIRLDRLIPANAPADGIHHTLYERSTEKERKLFARVAEQLGLTYDYVRVVAVGLRRSDAVAEALKTEGEKMEIKSTHGKQPGTLAALEAARQRSRQRVIDEMGLDPQKAVSNREAIKIALLATMPDSEAAALSFAGLRKAASIPSLALGKKVLLELLSERKIKRTGEGTVGSPHRYYCLKLQAAVE